MTHSDARLAHLASKVRCPLVWLLNVCEPYEGAIAKLPLDRYAALETEVDEGSDDEVEEEDEDVDEDEPCCGRVEDCFFSSE